MYKWKACLNVHGGQQEHGVHYWDTYAPVVTWQTLCFFLFYPSYLVGKAGNSTLSWHPPGNRGNATLHEAPTGLQTQRDDQEDTCAQATTKRILAKRMREIGFKLSKFDPCLYYHGSVVFFVYIDDCIVFGPSNQAIEQVVADIRTCSRQFMVDDQGDIGDFLGIEVQKQEDGSIMLTQPQLIDSILRDLHLQSSSNVKKTPSMTTSLLHKDTDRPEMTPDFHYRSVIGKLNFLEKSTSPDISISVHQCTRFSENPKQSHTEAVKRIGRYLLSSRDKRLLIHPNKRWHFDCWVDADFAGNWRQRDAHVDPMTSKSRSGWLVRFTGVPITWASKMQTITAMSTTEAEYIALSTSLRENIPMMGMFQEAREHGLQVDYLPPKVHCTIFEDNSGALELARLPKIRPRTKHINQSFHHFREHVERQEVSIQATPTDAQLADILTKPLPEAPFVRHRKAIMGW